MAGTPSWNNLYDKFYPQQTQARAILEKHSRSVAELAAEINNRQRLGLDPEMVELGAMLHDIGIFLTHAPSVHCNGMQPYIRHGVLGADLLRRHGYPEEIARIAERHTGAGITADDIAAMHLPLPSDRILVPETMLEKLICYADKFYSKSRDMSMKSLERVRKSLSKFPPTTMQRFEELHKLFTENTQ